MHCTAIAFVLREFCIAEGVINVIAERRAHDGIAVEFGDSLPQRLWQRADAALAPIPIGKIVRRSDERIARTRRSPRGGEARTGVGGDPRPRPGGSSWAGGGLLQSRTHPPPRGQQRKRHDPRGATDSGEESRRAPLRAVAAKTDFGGV